MSFKSILTYAARITPALALGALAALLYGSYNGASTRPGTTEQQNPWLGASVWQWLLSMHLLALHLVTTLFPLRAFRALGHVITSMRETAHDHHVVQHLTHCKSALRFAIILPTYCEDDETLRSTLSVLASHPQASSCYHVSMQGEGRKTRHQTDNNQVYLAMEDRETNAQAKATRVADLVRHDLADISITVHPFALPGEAPGKSSNESWAAEQVIRDYSARRGDYEVIVTIIDGSSSGR